MKHEPERSLQVFSLNYYVSTANFLTTFPKNTKIPQIELVATGDAEYFPVGVKHRYTRNPNQ